MNSISFFSHFPFTFVMCLHQYEQLFTLVMQCCQCGCLQVCLKKGIVWCYKKYMVYFSLHVCHCGCWDMFLSLFIILHKMMYSYDAHLFCCGCWSIISGFLEIKRNKNNLSLSLSFCSSNIPVASTKSNVA